MKTNEKSQAQISLLGTLAMLGVLCLCLAPLALSVTYTTIKNPELQGTNALASTAAANALLNELESKATDPIARSSSLASYLKKTNNLSDITSASTARSNLGLVIGSQVQAYDADLAAIAGLTSAADKLPYFTGSGTAGVADFTSFGRSLVDDADASTARATMGVSIGSQVQAYDADLAAIAGLTSASDKVPYFTGSGTAAVADFTSFGRSLVDDANAAAARTTLGLSIGSDVQAYDAQLTDIAGISFNRGDILYFNGTNMVRLAPGTSGHFLKTQGAGADPTWANIPGGGDMLAANNLSDVLSTSSARSNLGLAIGSNVQAYSAYLNSLATNSWQPGDIAMVDSNTNFVRVAKGAAGTAVTSDGSSVSYSTRVYEGETAASYASATNFSFNASSYINAAFTVTNNVVVGITGQKKGETYVLRLLTGAGGFTATPTNIMHFAGGTAPTLTTNASRWDIWTMYCHDGTNLSCVAAQNFQ